MMQSYTSWTLGETVSHYCAILLHDNRERGSVAFFFFFFFSIFPFQSLLFWFKLNSDFSFDMGSFECLDQYEYLSLNFCFLSLSLSFLAILLSGLAFSILSVRDKLNQRQVRKRRKKKGVTRQTEVGNIRFSGRKREMTPSPAYILCSWTKVSFVSQGLNDYFCVSHTSGEEKKKKVYKWEFYFFFHFFPWQIKSHMHGGVGGGWKAAGWIILWPQKRKREF